VDAAEHYRHLATLGREAFLAAAAQAAFVRLHSADPALLPPAIEDETVDETHPVTKVGPEDTAALAVFPIVKKPGASFPDRVTIGRTANNDIVLSEHSISRFHAYVRQDGSHWLFADAGSKNGCDLQGERLAPRKEKPLMSRAVVRVGDIELTFYRAIDLYAVLGGT
jgi:pSer/pThr/pTyr-binding forkhead associated (FHA) protein